MTPKILLLDLDDTLLGTKKLRLNAQFMARYLKAMKRRGHKPYEALEFFFRMQGALSATDPSKTNAYRLYETVLNHLGFEDMKGSREWVIELVDEIFSGLQSAYFAIPEAQRFLDWAEKQGKFRFVLATNPLWPLSIVHKRMQWGGLDPKRFDVVTHSEIMHSCKPHVSYFEELIRAMRVAPQDCLMIGDSLKKDGPALQVGVPVFLISSKSVPSFDRGHGVYRGSHAALRQFLERRTDQRLGTNSLNRSKNTP